VPHSLKSFDRVGGLCSSVPRFKCDASVRSKRQFFLCLDPGSWLIDPISFCGSRVIVLLKLSGDEFCAPHLSQSALLFLRLSNGCLDAFLACHQIEESSPSPSNLRSTTANCSLSAASQTLWPRKGANTPLACHPKTTTFTKGPFSFLTLSN